MCVCVVPVVCDSDTSESLVVFSQPPSSPKPVVTAPTEVEVAPGPHSETPVVTAPTEVEVATGPPSKAEVASASPPDEPAAPPLTTVATPVEPQCAPVATEAAPPQSDVGCGRPGASPVKKKAKKKKGGYASLMASVMAPTLSDADKAAELEAKVAKGLGGGQFSKLEKI